CSTRSASSADPTTRRRWRRRTASSACTSGDRRVADPTDASTTGGTSGSASTRAPPVWSGSTGAPTARSTSSTAASTATSAGRRCCAAGDSTGSSCASPRARCGPCAMSAEGTRRAIIAAFLANLGIAVSKFAAFVITGSASMLAESIHSVADTGNQGLLFLGGKRARKAPTAAHPFGFGTERYFWAFIVALVLFTLGSMFALYEGVEKLIHPEELESPIVAFAVLAVAVALEGWSLRTAHREATPSRRDRSWWAFIRTT